MNERKQVNRDVEQSRDSGPKCTTNNSGTKQSKRPLDWDTRDFKTDTWVRGGTGEYENRFFE